MASKVEIMDHIKVRAIITIIILPLKFTTAKVEVAVLVQEEVLRRITGAKNNRKYIPEKMTPIMTSKTVRRFPHQY